MPTYIALLKWTGQGIGSVKDSPSRLDAGRKAMKKSGVKIKDTYLTMGHYDLVCIIDAPDDETYASALLSLGAQGNVQTETLKAFSEDQYRKICASVQ
ncbi:MAG TPA: GYD domain-containing protein [Pyrinomonadaceae bacterium]|nr:GYD domain-containing protein [Pyrinomonadaceae bacterium]